MAEIKQARISGYLNPDMPEEDLQAKAIQRKQAAMQEAMGKYQIANLKEQSRVMGVNRKSEDWFNRNADMLYSQSSNPLVKESQKFSDPTKMADLYKKYQAEVGGNFAQFQQFVEVGKANEAKNNSRKLTMLIDEYGEDYPEIINKQLRAMEDGERNQLFSMLDDDTYSRLAELYDVDESYKLGDWWENNYGKAGLTVGTIGAAIYAAKKGKFGAIKEVFGGNVPSETIKKIANASSWKNHVKESSKAWRNLNPNASKKEFAEWQKEILYGGKGESKAKDAWKNFSDSGGSGVSSSNKKFSADREAKRIKNLKNRNIAPKMKGNVGLQVVPGQGVSSVLPPTVGRPYRMTAEQIRKRAIENNNELRRVKTPKSDVKFTGGQQSLFDEADHVIPQRKLAMHKAQVKTMVATGEMSQKQGKIVDDAINSIVQKGERVTKKGLAKVISETQGGYSLLDKIANKEIKGWKLFGYGIAGATMGGLTMGTIGGAIGGDTGEEVGEIAGTAMGAEMAPRMLKQLQTLVKEKGSKHIMDKIMKKKGSAYLAGLMAKGALGSLFSVGTYGIGSAATGLFLAKDIYDIYNILKEDID